MRPPASTPEAGRVEAVDALEVDDQRAAGVLVDRSDERAAQFGRGLEVQLALEVDDQRAAGVLVDRSDASKDRSRL